MNQQQQKRPQPQYGHWKYIYDWKQHKHVAVPAERGVTQ